MKKNKTTKVPGIAKMDAVEFNQFYRAQFHADNASRQTCKLGKCEGLMASHDRWNANQFNFAQDMWRGTLGKNTPKSIEYLGGKVTAKAIKGAKAKDPLQYEWVITPNKTKYHVKPFTLKGAISEKVIAVLAERGESSIAVKCGGRVAGEGYSVTRTNRPLPLTEEAKALCNAHVARLVSAKRGLALQAIAKK